MADEQFIDTLGLRLVAGRAFKPAEFHDWDAVQETGPSSGIPAVIITRSLAERLFPGQNALGKTSTDSAMSRRRSSASSII